MKYYKEEIQYFQMFYYILTTGSENKYIERRDTISVDNKNSSRTERRYVTNTNNEENDIYSIGGGH